MAGDDWSEWPFEEVIDFQEGPGILAKDFRENGVPLVRLSGLDRGGSVLEGCNYLDPETVKKRWAHFTLQQGDILLSTSASLGRIAVVGEDAVGAIAYTGLIRMRPRDERLYAQFIRYLLEGPDFQRQAEMVGVGSVIRHFGPMHLRQMSVRLPPPPEQRAITNILGTLDDKIELNRRMNETLEAMARAIFKSWFLDFEPVRTKAEGRNSGLPKHIVDLFPDRFADSELGKIPKGWHVRTLGEVLDVKHGFAFGGEFFREEPPGDILLTPGNFAIGGGFKDEKFKYYDGPLSQEFVLTEDDLLVTMTDLSKASDTLGYPAFVPSPPSGHRFLHNQRLGKIVISNPNRVNRLFLYRLFCEQDYRDEILASATGTTVKHTSPGRIKTFKTIFPPPELMSLYERVTKPQHLRAMYNRSESVTLTTLRDALLPKLIAGEIRVDDRENLLEAMP